MTDTPRTDANAYAWGPGDDTYDLDPKGFWVEADFARQLERELAQVTLNAEDKVLVPVEPTQAMMAAGLEADQDVSTSQDAVVANIYRAMLSAAKEG